MKHRVIASLAFLLLATYATHSSNFPNTAVPLPPGWPGPVFKLSQDYPASPPNDAAPWMQFDPTKDPAHYMFAVLRYCLQGNISVDWVIQNNPVRRWYHAPWMHWGNHGREPIHGLTYERVSAPGELSAQQTASFQNWAVGFYNPALHESENHIRIPICTDQGGPTPAKRSHITDVL